MATIDYKEKYEQALERARQFSEKPYLEDSAGIVEYIFPELRESEDERIRKALKEYFINSFQNNGVAAICGVHIKDILTWLEKQGEQKPVEWSQVDLISLGYLADFVDKNGDAFYGKNKPNVVKLVRSFAELPTHEHINDIEQKSSWSEEDEKTINNICHIIRQYDKISKKNQPCWYIGDCLLWMQNIKNKVIPQPRQEWSEEDEGFLCKCLGALGNPNYCYEDGELECMRNWLKSLRPKSQWKPSEEQIEVLDMVLTNETMDDNIIRILRELREQLKKLKE